MINKHSSKIRWPLIALLLGGLVVSSLAFAASSIVGATNRNTQRAFSLNSIGFDSFQVQSLMKGSPRSFPKRTSRKSSESSDNRNKES